MKTGLTILALLVFLVFLSSNSIAEELPVCQNTNVGDYRHNCGLFQIRSADFCSVGAGGDFPDQESAKTACESGYIRNFGALPGWEDGDGNCYQCNYDFNDKQVGCCNGHGVMCQIPEKVDFSINKIDIVQVINSPDLDNDKNYDIIASKPWMARVYVNIEFAEKKQVPVKLRFNGRDYIQFFTPKKEWSLKEIKNGENSANFFILKSDLNLFAGGPIEVSAEIDPMNAIEEANENNNQGVAYIETRQVKKVIKVAFIPIDIKVAGGDTYKAEKEDIESSGMQLEFLQEVYPVSQNIGVQADNMPRMTYTIKRDFLNQFANSKENYNEKAKLREKILKDLHKIAKEKNVYVLGIVNSQLMINSYGFLNGVTGSTFWDGQLNSILTSRRGDKGTLAHEVGHILGLYASEEQYVKYPNFGLLSDDGWCLNADGNSCIDGGARINIYREPNKDGEFISFMDRGESDYFTGSTLGKRYFDIMGNYWAWMNRSTYYYLMDKLTGA